MLDELAEDAGTLGDDVRVEKDHHGAARQAPLGVQREQQLQCVGFADLVEFEEVVVGRLIGDR